VDDKKICPDEDLCTALFEHVMIEHNSDLTAVAQELWDNDIHRLRPGTDYRIALQNKVAHLSDLNDGKEAAGSPLFTYVNETILKKETFLAFISLLDNYESDTGVPEVVTPEEEAENHRFLDSIIKTPVMKIVHRYLVEKKLSSPDTSAFKEQLHRIWFELYARRGSNRPDSSGFEHVFVGETRGGHTVIGFHNWIQLYLQEKLGHIDYKGYSVKADSPEPDENKHILALQFSWKNGIKPKGSIFIGVSPEFEFALYTLCFITSPNERVRMSFSLYDVEIVCHHYNQKHIGTTYPVLIRYQDADIPLDLLDVCEDGGTKWEISAAEILGKSNDPRTNTSLFFSLQLPSEEEVEAGPQVSSDAPPPYSSVAADNAAYFDYKEDSAFPKPPSYNVATSLPSYDEAERNKAETFVPLVTGRDEDFVARDDFEDADQLRIGNDGIFMLTFFMAFIFNWIGFFLSFCLTTSAAGRYGAISGFGLSLIKWILIVRFSTYFPGYFDGQYWLWWVFLVLGEFADLLPWFSALPQRIHQLRQDPQNGRLFLDSPKNQSPLYLLKLHVLKLLSLVEISGLHRAKGPPTEKRKLKHPPCIMQ
ncbi:hypothetical protein QTP86_014953, partial [Hemibagrus guttatus]